LLSGGWSELLNSGIKYMRKDSLNRTAGAVLLSAFLAGSAIVAPVNALGQDGKTASPSATPAAAKKDKKDKDGAKPSTVPTSGQLSPNQDPTLIGKRNINKGGDKFFGWLGGSKEKEMQIGRQMAAEIEQQSKMVEDPVITEYVNRVGQNIVLHSDAKMPFTIKVVDSDEINAFALPGGYFFVNKGLLLAADNESELAGVMAHEIAHVAARHAMENQGKSTFINYAALAGMIFGGPIVSTVLQNGGGILAGLAGLKFSRGAEEEADSLGVQYMYASGYDPTGMSTMFEKLASQNKKKPGTLARLFSTHPQSLQRRDNSLQLVSRFPEKEEYVISTSEFQRVKAYLLKMTNAKAGVVTDYDQTDDSKPTLKKRQPDSTDTPSTDADQGSSSSDGPPKLKKRNEAEPAPSPSPEK